MVLHLLRKECITANFVGLNNSDSKRVVESRDLNFVGAGNGVEKAREGILVVHDCELYSRQTQAVSEI